MILIAGVKRTEMPPTRSAPSRQFIEPAQLCRRAFTAAAPSRAPANATKTSAETVISMRVGDGSMMAAAAPKIAPTMAKSTVTMYLPEAPLFEECSFIIDRVTDA